MNIKKSIILVVGIVCFCGQNVLAKNLTSEKKENLLRDSDNLLSSIWFKRNVQISQSEIDGPGNESKAFRLTFEKNGFFGQIIRKAMPGKTYKFSIWMKSATDKLQHVNIIGENSKPVFALKHVLCKVTDEWQEFSVVIMCPEKGNRDFRFSVRRSDVFVWGPSVEEISTDK